MLLVCKTLLYEPSAADELAAAMCVPDLGQAAHVQLYSTAVWQLACSEQRATPPLSCRSMLKTTEAAPFTH
jgi:hypothetical protein